MRHRNSGLRKRCACKRRDWPKCGHSWQINYKPRGGQHYRISLDRELGRHVDSKTEAVGEAERIRTAIRNGSFRRAPAPANVADAKEDTLNTYVERDWLPAASLNLKASTVLFYTQHLRSHIIPLLGNRPLSGINRKDCRSLVTTVREKGLAITTVRGIVRTLSVVLSQAVEDEYLSANPALSMRKYLRRGDEPAPKIDPFNRDEVSALLATVRSDFPEWHAWLLCGLRTGLRAGELLGLQWGDIDWRGRYLVVRRAIVRGKVTTPKNHQVRRVDVSPQLRAVLRLWRQRKSAEWREHGLPRPDWVFSSRTGTALDESNVRKALNAILDKADLHRRGPHQMRHSFASLLLQVGEPITYVSRELGHRDSAITLQVYAHWMPDSSARKGVDCLDDLSPAVARSLHTSASPTLQQIA